MTGLGQAVEDYITLRRALGFKLERAGRLLPDFVAYVERCGSPFITTAIARDWAMQPASASPRWWATRLGHVRRFAQHMSALDPRTEVPPRELMDSHRARPAPYLYSDEDVQALMQAAGETLRGSLMPSTYSTLIGLLAATGMRVGEAIALDRRDLDEREGVLTIRDSKFGRSREVPLHTTVCAALQAYGRHRDRVLPQPKALSFFISQAGTRLIYQNIHLVFLRLIRNAGLEGRRPRRPRIHDLRHSFAMRTLQGWYRAGLDVQARLPRLSTYLGHVGPKSTYWYLTAVPELLGLAAERLEQAQGELP